MLESCLASCEGGCIFSLVQKKVNIIHDQFYLIYLQYILLFLFVIALPNKIFPRKGCRKTIRLDLLN